MEWITSIANAFSQLATISKERLGTLIIIALLVFILWYQNDQINSLKIKDDAHDKQCTEAIQKLRETHNIEMNKTTAMLQDQLNKFIIQKTIETDSIYDYFSKQIRKYDKRVNTINTTLKTLDEHE